MTAMFPTRDARGVEGGSRTQTLYDIVCARGAVDMRAARGGCMASRRCVLHRPGDYVTGRRSWMFCTPPVRRCGSMLARRPHWMRPVRPAGGAARVGSVRSN